MLVICSCIFALVLLIVAMIISSSLMISFDSLISSLSISAFSDKRVIPISSSIISRWSFTLRFKNGTVYVLSATICLNIAWLNPNTEVINICVSLLSPCASSSMCSSSLIKNRSTFGFLPRSIL